MDMVDARNTVDKTQDNREELGMNKASGRDHIDEQRDIPKVMGVQTEEENAGTPWKLQD